MTDPRAKASEPDGNWKAQAERSRSKRCTDCQRDRSADQATNSCTKTDTADLLCCVIDNILCHHLSPSFTILAAASINGCSFAACSSSSAESAFCNRTVSSA